MDSGFCVFACPVTTRLQFFLIAIAGWMNRHQQRVIDDRQEENRMPLELLGGKPRRFTDAQRIRMARKAKVIGRRRFGQIDTLVTPDTLSLWSVTYHTLFVIELRSRSVGGMLIFYYREAA